MIDLERESVSVEGAANELIGGGLAAKNADALLIVAPDGNIIFLNAAAEHLLGQSSEKLRERSNLEAVVRLLSMDGKQVRAEDMPVRRIFETREPMHDVRALLDLPDGQRIVLSVSASPLVGTDGEVAAALLSLRDVADRHGVEDIVRRHVATLRAQAGLLDLATDAIFVRDSGSGEIAYWNRGAEDLYGFSREEAIGKISHELLRTQFSAPLAAIEDTVMRTGEWAGELVHHTRDDRRVTVESRWALQRDDSGEPIAFLEINHDITLRREAEQKLSERVEQLVAANKEIESRNREIAAMNASMTAVTQSLELSQVLQNIVDAARDLVQCRYAALGVANAHGRITQFITSGITQEQRSAIGPLPEGHGLLGVLIHEGVPLRIENIGTDPRSQGFPPHHPPMKSLLGVPIRGKRGIVGNLYLTEKIGVREFEESDEHLLVIFAAQAALAIENARLYDDARTARDQLRVWNRNLEVTVAERTREIERVTRDVTARVFQGQESERRRIALELHDETAQSLASLLIELDLLKAHVPDEDSPLGTGMKRLGHLLKRTLDEVRTLSHDLRPSILDDFGLVAAIRAYADEWTQTFNIPVQVDAGTFPQASLQSDMEIALFRIVQEALMNVGKHARAQTVDVSLSLADQAVLLVIKDDGIGFDPDQLQAPTRQGGLGLYGMRERSALVGGDLTIDTAPGRGTRIRLEAPVS